MENNKINKFNLQFFADDGQGATTPETTDTQAPEKDYKHEYEKQLMEIEKLKNAISKTNSENAEYKKRELAKMSDEEKKQKEFQDLVEAKNKLESELQIIKLEKELFAEGFTKEESDKLISSKFSVKSFSEILKARVAEAVKSAEAELIKKTTPNPLMGDGTTNNDSGKTGFQKYQESKSQPNGRVEI